MSKRLFVLMCFLTIIMLMDRFVQAQEGPTIYLPLIVNPDNSLPTIGDVYSGDGTYYFATGAGNCLFPATPNDLMIVALNEVDYGNADYCGAHVKVTGPDGSVILRVVDRCPECAPGDVDLSLEAFAKIAEIPLGRVPVTWQIVSPPLEGDIIFHFKDGSNPWWTAVQIRNHRNPIAKVEVEIGNGVFQEISRTRYNYFVEDTGLGPGPYTFRVTDILGNVIINAGIPHVENGDVVGLGQFPAP